jgi:hypothetical protein
VQWYDYATHPKLADRKTRAERPAARKTNKNKNKKLAMRLIEEMMRSD